MFSAAEQTEIMTEMRTHTVIVDGCLSIELKFKRKPEIALFSDGSFETYKPYCVVKSSDVDELEIIHGTQFEISDENWTVTAIQQHDDGFYRIEVSKS